uniref:Uncharacterized protein n=1 Tax=Glossina austeni TaxID=7395 RepID=A0A1A9VE29_GLOAU
MLIHRTIHQRKHFLYRMAIETEKMCTSSNAGGRSNSRNTEQEHCVCKSVALKSILSHSIHIKT